MLKSDDLKIIQDVLKNAIKVGLDRPLDFDRIKDLVLVMERVDIERRRVWNAETEALNNFALGSYEKKY
jgi:hypothetical protein